ncbi:sulfatase [bacterium]|nr:sulfatase [bacterium]
MLGDAHALGATRKPNIVLFLVDDMGWMDCTPYGSKYYDTPNMQRVADQGMRFTSAYAMPLCSPTRASILTGQYSSRHGITSATGHMPPQEEGHNFLPKKAGPNSPLVMPESKNYLEPSQYTLAEALREAGYRTGHFGKWHVGLTEPHWPSQQGFDVTFFAPDPGPPSSNYFSPYNCVLPGAEPPERPEGERFTYGTITDGPPGEYIADRLTDESLKFIAENKDRPFFLNLWHFSVHGPWGHKESITAEMAKRTDPTGRQDNPVMASMLKSVDESLGRVLDKIDELNLADDTIIIFKSDNGGFARTDPLGGGLAKRADLADTVASYHKWADSKAPTNNEPLRSGKGSIYEGGIRVPLIVRWPGRIAPGTTSDAVVGCIDVYPTVLDLISLAPNPRQKIDGVSYAPVLRGTGTFSRDAYFTWFPGRGVCVRQGDWKLIRRFRASDGVVENENELYNLKDDIGETTNLAARMPEKVKELDALIDGFIEDTGALYPKPNPAYKLRPAAKPAANAPAEPVAN